MLLSNIFHSYIDIFFLMPKCVGVSLLYRAGLAVVAGTRPRILGLMSGTGDL